MNPLARHDYDTFASSLLSEFGAETPPAADKYLYDSMIVASHPPWFRPSRQKCSLVIDNIRRHAATVRVFFDQHPNNRRFISQLAARYGFDEHRPLWGVEVAVDQLREVLMFDQCDMYVACSDGRLVCVGTHEDDIVDGERVVWANGLL